MEVIDMDGPAEHARLKALVYGKSGTGKTNFGVSAPRPLILLNERQAIPHIKAAAKRLGIKRPDTLLMKNLEDYRNVLRACQGDPAQPFVVRGRKGDEEIEVFRMDPWPETLVIDSLTEACELIAAEIRLQSPPKDGKDGLPVDSERYWNVFSDRASKLIRAFRDVDLNILFLCLIDDRMIGEGEDAHRWVGPMLTMRKLPGVVQAAVNVVGVTFRKTGKDNLPEYGIRTMGPDYVELKPFPPLRPVEVTDFTSWCKRINGQDDGAQPPKDVPVDAGAEPAQAEAAKKSNGKKAEKVAAAREALSKVNEKKVELEKATTDAVAAMRASAETPNDALAAQEVAS